ncbi:MAG: PQQ-binding-like beta-propeller repeat protein [Flavobacteriaceae bacterium]|nr:PQQ-binding-like beta-propeller repeat protein [Flavobacteriaceae bacterium]
MNRVNFIKRIALVVFFISTTGLVAQEPSNQYSFDGNVKWMMLSESGVLVASTGEALVGIKPNQPDLHFKFERVKNVKEEHLEPVPGTPYLIIKPRGMMNHTVVIDVVKGKMVFDSKKEDWQGGVASRHLIYPEMMFVVNGMHREKGLGQYTQGVGLYDLKTGELVKIFERKASNAMVGVPDIKGNTIIIPGLKNVKAYDISSGSTIWTAEVKNATRISSNDANDEIYAFRTKGGNTVVYKIDGKSGNQIWSEGNKLKGNLARYEFTKAGLAVVCNVDNSGKSKLMKLASGSSQSKVYLLDTNTGADLWAKSPKTKGYINHFYIEDDGILFGVASGGINKISFDGTPLWKKPLKTGANIQLMARVDKGVLYISESDADIIDMNSGESVFGKKIKYKRSEAVASAFDESRGRFLLSCKDGLYAIDGNDGSYEIINGDPNFEGKEVVQNIEIRDNNLLLSSDQNMTWLNFDGSEKNHVFHRAPGKSAFGLILAGTLTAMSATAAISHSAQAGYLKGAGVPSYNSTVNYHEQQADSWANIADQGFQEMAKRFKATKATENAAFILTKIDGGVGLIKVDKDSGETVKEILVKDKKPMYEVDDFEGVLYFKADNKSIHAYNLND